MGPFYSIGVGSFYVVETSVVGSKGCKEPETPERGHRIYFSLDTSSPTPPSNSTRLFSVTNPPPARPDIALPQVPQNKVEAVNRVGVESGKVGVVA